MSADLPQSWLPVQLNDVSEIVTGKTPSTKNLHNFGGGVPFIKPADLDRGGYITQTVDTLTDIGAASVPRVPANSIPVTCIGNLGKVGITNQTSATNQQINTVVPSSLVEHRFLYYQLQTLKPWMQDNASATTVTIINKGKFSKAPVILVPLAEQKVIADKLDTLLVQVENTKARLERIPQILKRFRQSLLAAAVSGRLTEEWRKTNQLQTAWERVPFAELLLQLRSGAGDKPDDDPKGTPILRSSAVRSMEIDFSDIRYLAKSEQLKKNNFLKPADLLFTRLSGSAEYVGNCAMVRSIDCQYQFPDRLFCARLKEPRQARFLEYFCASQAFIEHIQGSLKSSAGHQRITLDVIKTAVVTMPPLEEQTEIVRRVDQLFAHADRIEQQVNNALARVNNLTQSILAKAFRGELTEQWRKDNPELISGENRAAALLERIKAERTVPKPAKKAQKKVSS